MTPFNIPGKQLHSTGWMSSIRKKRLFRKLKRMLCRECFKEGYWNNRNYDGYEVEWDKIKEGDWSKRRCYFCKRCRAKNCCPECGRDYTDSGEFKISEEHCGYCRYLNKWGPNGYEYLELQETNEI
jgi:hypothetical protein